MNEYLQYKKSLAKFNPENYGLATIDLNPTELCNRLCHFCPRSSFYPSLNLNMSIESAELLKERLANFGEFLPVKAEGNSMVLFNLLTFGQEQKDMCLTKYEDGFEDGLELLTFEQDNIQNKLLFKSKLEGAQKVYCTDEFKNIIQSNNLKGLVFDEDLLDPFV